MFSYYGMCSDDLHSTHYLRFWQQCEEERRVSALPEQYLSIGTIFIKYASGFRNNIRMYYMYVPIARQRLAGTIVIKYASAPGLNNLCPLRVGVEHHYLYLLIIHYIYQCRVP